VIAADRATLDLSRPADLGARLDELALGSEKRGPIQEHEHGLPSYRGPE
jgi:hypothetical protein